jgi:uridylate kinase
MADDTASDTSRARFRRVLLKVSGEALGSDGRGIDAGVMQGVAEDLAPVVELGVQVGIVVGGGNIFRGMSQAAKGMNRSVADSMGMLATVINALAIQESFNAFGIPAAAMSAISMPTVCEPYTRRRAIERLQQGTVVVLGAGTSNPYFTTDTAACLRALEIGADVVMKGTKVDGVYDKDPMLHADAVRHDRLSYAKAMDDGLRIMDSTAFSLCKDNGLPIFVFNMLTRGNIVRAVCGDAVGTIVDAAGAD